MQKWGSWTCYSPMVFTKDIYKSGFSLDDADNLQSNIETNLLKLKNFKFKF